MVVCCSIALLVPSHEERMLGNVLIGVNGTQTPGTLETTGCPLLVLTNNTNM